MAKNTNAQLDLGTHDKPNISSSILANDKGKNPELCSGYGQFHSNESGAKRMKPYVSVPAPFG